MEFEAFLLANYSLRTRRESQQWIHTTVLACVEERDCRPVRRSEHDKPLRLLSKLKKDTFNNNDLFGKFCLQEICSDSAPAYGRRKRTDDNNEAKTEIRFDNRIPMRILLPKGSFSISSNVDD